MKNKFVIPVYVLSLISLSAYSQTGDKKADSIKPAKEIIRDDSGEKGLPMQLKENQLKAQPVVLNAELSTKTAQANNKKAKPVNKHQKRKRS